MSCALNIYAFVCGLDFNDGNQLVLIVVKL